MTFGRPGRKGACEVKQGVTLTNPRKAATENTGGNKGLANRPAPSAATKNAATSAKVNGVKSAGKAVRLREQNTADARRKASILRAAATLSNMAGWLDDGHLSTEDREYVADTLVVVARQLRELVR